MCEATNMHILLVGIKNDSATWGNKKFAMSYKIIYTLKIRPSNPTLIYQIKWKFTFTRKPVCDCS